MLKLLLPVLLIGVSFESPPERILCVCTDNGQIQVMNDGITQYKSLYSTEGDNQCTVKRTTKAAGSVKFIIYGCSVELPVKATLMEEEQDTIGTNVIFGGKGVAGYELQCGGVPIGGSLTVLQVKLQVGFYARSCLAEGSRGQVKKMISEGKTLDLSIITDFADLAQGDQGRMQTWATLYAFHFVDSEEITVNCTVFACRSDDTACQATIPHDKRPKRAVNEGNDTRMDYVQDGIRVIDEYYYPTSSGSALNFLPGHFALATLMYFLFGE